MLTTSDTTSPKLQDLNLSDPLKHVIAFVLSRCSGPCLDGIYTHVRECVTPLGVTQRNPALRPTITVVFQQDWLSLMCSSSELTDLTVSLTGTCVPQGSAGSQRKYESHCQEGGSVRLYMRLHVHREQKERASAPRQSAKWSAALLPETKGISEDGWSAGGEMVYLWLQTSGTKSCLLVNFPIVTLQPKDFTFLSVKGVWRVSRLYFKEDIGIFIMLLYLLVSEVPFPSDLLSCLPTCL